MAEKSRTEEETMASVEEYRGRYDELLDTIHRDVDEFLATGQLSRARRLSEATGQHLNHNEWPLYFTGDLDARFVLVHLNPKHENNFAPRHPNPAAKFSSFEEFFEFHRHFGARVYGPRGLRRRPVSVFDQKQIRFLRPFGVIDFVDDRQPDARWINLEKAIDHKLQMELVPYGSPNFSARGFTPDLLREDYERLMSVINATQRDYMFFCGAVFEPLLRDYIAREHAFHLRKKDGTREPRRSRFAELILLYQGNEIRAGLAHSWARQGIPMTSYAEECKAQYGD